MNQQLRSKRKCWKNITVFIILVLTCACDGGIGVKGKVYTKDFSQKDSQCYIDEIPALPSNLIPLKDAKIILYHADITKENIDKNTWTDSTVSNIDGGFSVGGTAAPFHFDATLVVEKEGFKSVSKVFPHIKNDSDEHIAVIVLEPVNSEKK